MNCQGQEFQRFQNLHHGIGIIIIVVMRSRYQSTAKQSDSLVLIHSRSLLDSIFVAAPPESCSAIIMLRLVVQAFPLPQIGRNAEIASSSSSSPFSIVSYAPLEDRPPSAF